MNSFPSLITTSHGLGCPKNSNGLNEVPYAPEFGIHKISPRSARFKRIFLPKTSSGVHNGPATETISSGLHW